ncbi:MAG TPA: TerB family tellurite resistance protein [Gemmatimonadales bacterium]|nr:TerB family tellurite resistance protein [Gemmatimonadales bacterium]
MAGARLATALENAIAELRRRPSRAGVPVPLPASTVLLLELAAADATLAPEALAAVEARAVEHWGLGPLAQGQKPDVEYLAHARKTAASADHAERVALAAEVWRATMADGALSAHESELLARIASFLSLTTEDIAEARRLGGLQRLT